MFISSLSHAGSSAANRATAATRANEDRPVPISLLALAQDMAKSNTGPVTSANASQSAPTHVLMERASQSIATLKNATQSQGSNEPGLPGVKDRSETVPAEAQTSTASVGQAPPAPGLRVPQTDVHRL